MAACVAVAVPEITPVTLLNAKPAGRVFGDNENDGDVEKLVALKAVVLVIAVFL